MLDKLTLVHRLLCQAVFLVSTALVRRRISPAALADIRSRLEQALYELPK